MWNQYSNVSLLFLELIRQTYLSFENCNFWKNKTAFFELYLLCKEDIKIILKHHKNMPWIQNVHRWYVSIPLYFSQKLILGILEYFIWLLIDWIVKYKKSLQSIGYKLDEHSGVIIESKRDSLKKFKSHNYILETLASELTFRVSINGDSMRKGINSAVLRRFRWGMKKSWPQIEKVNLREIQSVNRIWWLVFGTYNRWRNREWSLVFKSQIYHHILRDLPPIYLYYLSLNSSLIW